MIAVKAIDHVCLWVRSLSEAQQYYERIFDFQCRKRKGSTDTLIVESEKVHFFIREIGVGSKLLPEQHISFEVDSLASVIENLRSAGIFNYELGETNFFKYRNYKWCEWKDPNGIRLECIEII